MAMRRNQKVNQAQVTFPATPCLHQKLLMSPLPLQQNFKWRRKPKRRRTTCGESSVFSRVTWCQSPLPLLIGWRTLVLYSITSETASNRTARNCPPTHFCSVLPAASYKQCCSVIKTNKKLYLFTSMRAKIKIITNEQNCNDIVLFHRFVTILNNENVQVSQHACLWGCWVFFSKKRKSNFLYMQE